MINAIFHELRDAMRAIVAQPGFSMLIVGVLATGLACVLFMTVILNGLLIRPLPFAAPEQLLHLGFTQSERADRLDQVSERDLVAWQNRLGDIADVAAYSQSTINLSDAGRAERFAGAEVSTNFLRVMGVPASIGRTFSDADGQPGAAPTVLLSDGLWRQRYNADPDIVGRVLRVNSGSASVIGVMPPDFSFPFKEVIWLPASLDADTPRDEGEHWVVVARRHADASALQVIAALERWSADTRREAPRYFETRTVGLEPLTYLFIDHNTRAIFNVIFLAVLLVLLVACANAANLMLSRTLARRQELAVRAALGASRARLALHLLSQSLLLSGIAGAIALPLGWAAAIWVDQIFRNSEEGPPHWMHFDLDGPMIGFALIAALVTGLVAGLLPALRAGSAVSVALRDDSRAVAGGSFARVSRGLVIGEIAVSCVLLVAAGIMLTGMVKFENDDFGIRTDGLLTARIGLPESKFSTGAEQIALFERLDEALRADPEVTSAAVGTTLPGLLAEGWHVVRDGAGPDDPQTLVYAGRVDEHFAETYQLTLEEGRLFNAGDRADTLPVVIVDRTFAELFGQGKSVLGQRFKLDPDDPDGALVTVVGVIKRVQLDDLDDPVRPALLQPLRQDPARFVSLAIRTRGEPAAFAPRLNEILREVEPDTPAYWVRTYDQVIREATFGVFILSRMFLVFGGVALFLAAAGVYGVIAFNVRQRTREIGVRRALGAPSASVLRSLLARAVRQIGLGLAIGMLLAWPFSRSLVGNLNGFDAGNPVIYALVLATLALAALIAVLVPAYRALRVDPLIALRHE